MHPRGRQAATTQGHDRRQTDEAARPTRQARAAAAAGPMVVHGPTGPHNGMSSQAVDCSSDHRRTRDRPVVTCTSAGNHRPSHATQETTRLVCRGNDGQSSRR